MKREGRASLAEEWHERRPGEGQERGHGVRRERFFFGGEAAEQ